MWFPEAGATLWFAPTTEETGLPRVQTRESNLFHEMPLEEAFDLSCDKIVLLNERDFAAFAEAIISGQISPVIPCSEASRVLACILAGNACDESAGDKIYGQAGDGTSLDRTRSI